MARPGVALSLLAAMALAGCTGTFVAARVPDSLVQGNGGNGWDLDGGRTDPAPRSEAGGLVQRQTLAYEDDPREGGNGGYSASLVLTTLKLVPTPSEGQLRDIVRQQVEQHSATHGISLQPNPAEGQRTLLDRHGTLYFVYTGTITAPGELFTTVDASVRVLGEVWNCPESGTSVAAVALAQVSSVRSIGGIPVATQTDTTNWREVAADPSGTVDGQRGADGLVYNARCAA